MKMWENNNKVVFICGFVFQLSFIPINPWNLYILAHMHYLGR
jgi:hypothetical protein